VRPLLPRGLHEMRAESRLFAGDPRAADLAERRGLYGVALPDHVALHLVFAADGGRIANYTQGFLQPLAGQLVAWYTRDVPVRGDARLVNFWRALRDSAAYAAFSFSARDLADADRLDERAMQQLLRRHFPIFPGDHTGVLSAGSHFLDYLATRLRGAQPDGFDLAER
jgi:hypothetical protein